MEKTVEGLRVGKREGLGRGDRGVAGEAEVTENVTARERGREREMERK